MLATTVALHLNYNHINLLYNYCNFLQLAPAKTDVEQKSFDDVVLSCQQVQLITFKKCLDRFANLWPAGTFVTRSLSSVPSPSPSPSPSPWTSSSPSWVHSATVRSTPPHLSLAFLLSFSILIALHGSVSEKETDRQTDRGGVYREQRKSLGSVQTQKPLTHVLWRWLLMNGQEFDMAWMSILNKLVVLQLHLICNTLHEERKVKGVCRKKKENKNWENK